MLQLSWAVCQILHADFQHWKWATPIWTPLASSLRGCSATPLGLPSLRIGSPTIVLHPAELQWLLARRAQPSQRCELSLLENAVIVVLSPYLNPENSLSYPSNKQTSFKANLNIKNLASQP